MMDILEEVHQKSQNIEEKFPHKRILYISQNTYSSPTITILQGLDKLGFKIYTLGKSSINSWWCNKVIGIPGSRKFDFVLSSLGSGVLWEHYDKYELYSHIKVLIDGMDTRKTKTWREKYAFFRHRERKNPRPSKAILREDIQPYCWYAPLGDYAPDIVFMTQKIPGSDETTFYLPVGIQLQALALYEGKSGHERNVDFFNLPGNGDGRRALTQFVATGRLPGKVHNGQLKRRPLIPKEIKHLVKRDRHKAHGWDRWVQYQNYFEMLNDTKVYLYPSVTNADHLWDALRLWNALASGCLCLLQQPNIDISQYPVTELCPEMQYVNHEELLDKAEWLYRNPGKCERLRLQVHEGALKYFTPIPLARRFLWRIWQLR